MLPQILRAGVALLGLLGQQPHGGGFQSAGHVHSQPAQRHRWVLHVLVGHRHRGVALERRSPGQHLVQHHAEGVQVAAGVGRLAPGLLGREVGGGSHHCPGLGQAGGGPGTRHQGDAEVGDLHVPVGAQQHVLWFDIAVDDPRSVGEGQRSSHLEGHGGGRFGVEGAAAGNDRRQAVPADVLHDDEVAVPLASPVVDADDVGVAQPGCGVGLAPQALGESGIVGELRVQHLECHVPVQLPVAGQVHAGHASLRQAAHEFVAPAENRRFLRCHSAAIAAGSLRVRPCHTGAARVHTNRRRVPSTMSASTTVMLS